MKVITLKTNVQAYLNNQPANDPGELAQPHVLSLNVVRNSIRLALFDFLIKIIAGLYNSQGRQLTLAL